MLAALRPLHGEQQHERRGDRRRNPHRHRQLQGALATVPAVDLGAAVIKQLLKQTELDPAQVDEVILGQVLTAGAGQNPARQAAIKAGLPFSVPALTLNKVCGSGLKALHLAAQAIRCGDAEVVIAGGQENMSLAPT